MDSGEREAKMKLVEEAQESRRAYKRAVDAAFVSTIVKGLVDDTFMAAGLTGNFLIIYI